MNIVISDDYQDAVRTLDAFRKLDSHSVTIYNDAERNTVILAERLRDADALVLIRERTPITADLLALLPNLKLIVQTGRGIPHIDLEACARHGIAVSTGGGSPTSTAELTWALALAAMRSLPEEMASLKAGNWQSTIGLGMKGRTLGILGYGKIGSIVAGYGRAFGMRVLAWGREGSLTRARSDGYETAPTQQALFEQADVLCLHLKLTAETRGIVKASDLAKMKPTSLLVNTARAELIESGALVAGLQQGRPRFAAVDVYESEPVADHPLLHMPNALCTPHLGYVERDNYEQYFSEAFDQLNAFAQGNPTGIINPDALSYSP